MECNKRRSYSVKESGEGGREVEVESENPSRPGRESKQETKQLEVDI